MDWKRTYTKIFLKQLGKETNEENLKYYNFVWWNNPSRRKEQGGLRLTDEGFRMIVEDLELQLFEIPYPEKNYRITSQILVWLDRYVKCPFYLSRARMYVTDERVAIEFHLFGNDLEKFGYSKALSHEEK